MNDQTKKECISIANHFYRNRMSGKKLDTDSIWAALLHCAPEYSPNYFSRLKYAIAYHQNEIGNGWTAKVIKNTPNPVKAFPEAFPDTLYTRAKSITIERLTQLTSHLFEKGLTAECAALLLIFRTGARPCELAKMKVVGNEIFIEGAKKTEKGNRGADRVLIGLNEDIASDVSSFLNTLAVSQKSMDAIRFSIYKAVKELYPRDKKTISLYTLRHQFGANLKASNMSRIEMAYVMGHQSTASISRYGNKKQGVSEWVVVKPARSADLALVRDKALTKVWNKSKVAGLAVAKKVGL